VNLTSATNATIFDGQGKGTIQNDDSQPTISINDVTADEGNAGLTAFGFTVSLSNPSAQTGTVSRQTANGSASAGSDYTALGAATITFNPGETSKPVTVNVNGDTAIEPNETFFVNLSGATNATIADNQGLGTIQNDDLSSSGACTITGTSGNDVLTGTPGNDVICGLGGDDQLSGLGGRDVLRGGSGKDLALGGADADLLLGDTGYDDLRGQGGNDTIRGGEGGDSLLHGGPGSDALFGENGIDTLNTQDGVAGNDRADGGSSSDKCTFDSGDFLVSCP
jgi:Ca2+-binding RTX toxin-like protein